MFSLCLVRSQRRLHFRKDLWIYETCFEQFDGHLFRYVHHERVGKCSRRTRCLDSTKFLFGRLGGMDLKLMPSV